MELKGVKVGFVLTGSFCTFKKVIPKIKELIKQEAEVIPIMSYNSYNLDTKFGKAKDFINEIEEITGKEIIHNKGTSWGIIKQSNYNSASKHGKPIGFLRLKGVK